MSTILRRGSDPGSSSSDPLVTKISATRAISARFYLRELWTRRDLLRVLTGRELRAQYEIHLIGFLWWMLEPLSLMAVYVLVVDVIFGRGGFAYPLFVMTALLPYKWLASSLVGAANTIRGNASLINDVYFPRALLPMQEIVVGMLHFTVGLLVLPVLMVMYGITPDWHLLWLPVVMLVQSLLLLGLSYPMSVLGLKFRNLPRLAGNIFRIWFYLSPGIWHLDRLNGHPGLKTLIKFNPLTGLFESYRGALGLYQEHSGAAPTGAAPGWELLWTLAFALGAIVIGGRYYIRREAQFGKML